MSERLLTAIRESTPAEKLAAVAEIVRDLLRADAEGTFALTDDQRARYLALLPAPPPEVTAQLPTDDPTWVAEMQRRGKGVGKGLTAAQVIAELKRRAASPN